MSKTSAEIHKPVLLDETKNLLNLRKDSVIVDATLGLGGHTEAILSANETVKVIGIDQDLEAISFAEKRLEKFSERIKIVHANFSDVKTVLDGEKADGILADLGVSSLQFDSETRGFSFRFDAPLDMRMNADGDDETAADLLKTLSETEIANLIYEYGEERASRRIARRIVEKREKGTPIETTAELAYLVKGAIGRGAKDKIHPATRTFQALRIAVNRELEILEKFLEDAVESLKTDGRLAVITFHSLEDRIVKRTFQKLAGKCSCPPRLPICNCGATKKIEILTRKPSVPNDIEVTENPRARSAKLRACLKI